MPFPHDALPPDVALLAADAEGAATVEWPSALRFLAEGETSTVLSMSYLTEADRQNPDTMANVGAIEDVSALTTWVVEDEDESTTYGYWHGSENTPPAQAPIVIIDSEGQFSLLPGASLAEALCSHLGEWADDGYAGLADQCRALGIAVAQDDPAGRPQPAAAGSTPSAVHREGYERRRA